MPVALRWALAIAVCASLACAPGAPAASTAITTIAGNGTQGTSGDGGPATSAQFAAPLDVSIATSGFRVLIADFGGFSNLPSLVRSVAANGSISTAAGGGSSTAEGIPATQASLTSDNNVEATADGGFLLADGFGHRVRKVSAGGIIRTVAGTGQRAFSGDTAGPATARAIDFPVGIAASADGSFLFAEAGNHRVRLVDKGGTISTFAGSGQTGENDGGFSGDGGPATAARLNGPLGISLRSDGSLLIADTRNNRIRLVANGIITTVAGTGAEGDSGDGGPATAARLKAPAAVEAIPNSTAFLVSDQQNQRVRLVDAGGKISTIAGTGTAGFNGDNRRAETAQLNFPTGLAAFAGGAFLIADQTNQRIRFVGPDTDDDGIPDAFDTPPATGTPAPPLTPGPTPTVKRVAAKGPAKIRVLRAGVSGGALDMLVEITARAVVSGAEFELEYLAAGRRTRFTVPIRSSRVRIRRRPPAAQRLVRRGIVTLTFAGTPKVDEDVVRLRAAAGKSNLELTPAELSGGTLTATGTISRRARGVVRIALRFARADGSTGIRRFNATIANGRWRLSRELTGPAADGGQLSIQFTGFAPAGLRGEQTSKAVP